MRRAPSDATGLTRKHRPDYQIVLFMGLLMMLGLIVMYAIGPQRAQVLNASFGTDNYTATYFFIKQAASLLLAIIAFTVIAKLPYTWLKEHAALILKVAIGSCIVLALAGWLDLGIAQKSLGATRWFDLGPFGSLQPAEFLKFGLLLFSAGFIARRANQGLINDVYKTLIPVGALLLMVAFIVIGLQKDMGTGIAMLAIVAAMMMVAGVSVRTGVILLAGAVGLGALMIVTAGHRMKRVAAFLQGDAADLTDAASYHIVHAKIAIGSGGWNGVGIGNSVQATGYLPEAINDSVFAIMGETFGFIGLVVILALFTALLFRLLRVADRLPSLHERLLAIGVFGWLAAHVILNVAAMTGVFPLTGITLPLLSFGGTSMVFIAGALGLAFQLSSYTDHELSNEGERYENSRSRRGLRRPRDTSRSSRN